MRTLVDLPDRDVERLDALARRKKVSRAAVIRHAVERHLDDSEDNSWIRRGAGRWKGRTDIGDAIEYQQSMREDRDPC